MTKNDTTTKIPMYVDTVKYDNVFGIGLERSRRNDYAHNYELMYLPPHDIKNFIDKGIDMKAFKE